MRQLTTRAMGAIVVTIALFAVFGYDAPRALAGSLGRASGNQAVSSGTWKVTPSTTVITFPISLGASTPQYLTVTNNGSLSLIGTRYTLTIAGVSVGTVALKACSGTWNETAHTCSGTTSTIVSGTTATSPASASTTTSGQYPASPAGSLRLQMSNSGAVTVAVVVTLSVTVSRSQVRTATTTTS